MATLNNQMVSICIIFDGNLFFFPMRCQHGNGSLRSLGPCEAPSSGSTQSLGMVIVDDHTPIDPGM